MPENQQDFFTANFSLLRKHHPELWQRIKDTDPEPAGEPVYSSGGLPNLLVKSIQGEPVFLHDQENPEAEIPQFLRIVPPNATGFVIFLGMGLGYSPLAFLEHRPQINRLVIFETDIGIFCRALRAMDLTPLLKTPRVILLVGEQPDIPRALAPYQVALTTESIYTLEHNRVFALNPEGFTRLKNEVFEFANSMNVGGNTIAAHGKSFVENRFRQLSAIGHDFFLDSLHKEFAGLPAILVAGGPSLNKNIEYLAEAKGKALILAVDSVLPSLLKRGIKPDFVGSIDMQPLTYEKYADHARNLAGVSLICAPWVTPAVPKRLQVDRVFWLFSGNKMEGWLNSRLGGKLTFPGAGTVAQLNFFAAVLLGCSPIILVGQDFAYSDDLDHAADVVISNQETVTQMLTTKQGLHLVPGTLGGTVATSRSFLSMKNALEQAIKANPNTYINATEGGAAIAGTTALSLREALERYCSADQDQVLFRINGCLEQAQPPTMATLVTELATLVKQGEKQLQLVAQSDTLCLALKREIDKMRGRAGLYTDVNRLSPGFRKKLGENDRLQAKLDASPIWPLMEDVTMDGLREAERLKAECERLQADPKSYLVWLQKALERLLLINQVRRRELDFFLPILRKTLVNYQREQELAGRDPADKEAALELIRHHQANGDIRLARIMLEKFDPLPEHQAEVNLMRGRIAALQADFALAEQCFAEACRLDSQLAGEIGDFRKSRLEEYLAMYKDRQKTAFGKKMLLKGLGYDPQNQEANEILQKILEQDLARITAEPEPDSQNTDGDDLAKFWFGQLQTYPHLLPLLTPAQRAAIFLARGRLYFNEEDYAAALPLFERATAEIPDDPQPRIAAFEAAFNQGEFAQAVAALDQAVALDRALAVHWEELGDLLVAGEAPEDALAAYEKCFTALPEAVEVLKKIGDCYQALNQPEAAYEAYQQLAQRLSGSETESV